MYFFVCPTQLYLSKYIKKSVRPLFQIQFWPIWAQTVSKLILIKHKFSIFYQLLYFRFFTNCYISEMFLPISQNSKNAQTCKTVTNVTQKREVVWLWKLAQMLSIHRATRFWYLFSNFNYVAKFSNLSVSGCHDNRIKNPAPWTCAQCTHTSSSQVWLTCNISFWVTFVTVFSQ